MKKMFVAAIMCLGLAASSVEAKEETGFYARFNTGLSFVSDIDVESSGLTADIEADSSRILGFAAGVTLNKVHDIEFEYSNTEYDADKFNALGVAMNLSGAIKTNSYMVNYRYNFLKDKWTPYLLAGIGMTDTEWTGGTLSLNGVSADVTGGSDTSFVYQLGFGTKYALNENWDLDASYRFANPSELTIDGDKYDYSTNNVLIGIAYNW